MSNTIVSIKFVLQCYQYYSSVLSLDMIYRLTITDFYAHTHPEYDICPNANFL